MYVDVSRMQEPEEANSSHGQFKGSQGVLDQDPTCSSDGSCDNLNLVISGTSSVDPNVHEGLSKENDDACAQVQILCTSEVTLHDDALPPKTM